MIVMGNGRTGPESDEERRTREALERYLEKQRQQDEQRRRRG